MGRRERLAKVVAVPRKSFVNSCSSREPSFSPEQFLFHATDGAKVSHNDPLNQSSSSQCAVGLSWVSVLKSSMKQATVPGTPQLPIGTAAQLSVLLICLLVLLLLS